MFTLREGTPFVQRPSRCEAGRHFGPAYRNLPGRGVEDGRLSYADVDHDGDT